MWPCKPEPPPPPPVYIFKRQTSPAKHNPLFLFLYFTFTHSSHSFPFRAVGMPSSRRTIRSQVTQVTNSPAAEVSVPPISVVPGVPRELVGDAKPSYRKVYGDRMNDGLKNSEDALMGLETAYPAEYQAIRHATPVNGRSMSKPDKFNMFANAIQ
jgi:hypothetical protein